MKIIIEENDVFRIHILIEDGNDLELSPLKPKIILYCLRFRPFIREEIWNVYEDSIVNEFIEKFKALEPGLNLELYEEKEE